jgi:hypothetical protein
VRIARRDEALGEGYDLSAWWYVAMVLLMFWLVMSEPTEVTGSVVSKRIVLERLPWSWAPALASWLAFTAIFHTCRAQQVDAWSDLDGPMMGSVALGVLWRFGVWTVVASCSIYLGGRLGLTYDAAMWFIVAAAVVNGVIAFFRRGPEDLWD